MKKNKNREIKFRGKRIDGNGYAYGDLQHKYNGREIWIDGWQVVPDSVSQFGYDAGTENFEGVDNDGTGIFAAIAEG